MTSHYRSPLPTVVEILTSLGGAVDERDVRSLANVLQASYDELGSEDYESLADEYCEATDDGNDLQQDIVVAFARLADWYC